MCRWHHPDGRKWRGTKKPLDESERGEWKSWLKAQHSENEDHGIWSNHFMVNRWGNNENSERLYFFGSKITADGDPLHEIKRCLLLGRKAMSKLDTILKSRDITLPTKVRLVKAMVLRKLFSSVQSLSCVQLFATPWPTARQSSLSITNSQTLDF